MAVKLRAAATSLQCKRCSINPARASPQVVPDSFRVLVVWYVSCVRIGREAPCCSRKSTLKDVKHKSCARFASGGPRLLSRARFVRLVVRIGFEAPRCSRKSTLKVVYRKSCACFTSGGPGIIFRMRV